MSTNKSSGKSDGITVEFIDVTPALAQEWLEKHNTRNRPLVKQNVELYKDQLHRGEFLTTHQGIAFDKKGRLQDGQNRLQAIWESGKTVRMMVSRGWPPENVFVLDSNKKRSASDDMVIEGVVDSNVAKTTNAACNILINWHAGRNSTALTGGGVHNSKATRKDLVEYAKRHPEVAKSAEVGNAAAKGNTFGLSKSHLTAYHVVFSLQNKEKADEFFRLYAEHGAPAEHPLSHLSAVLNKDSLRRRSATGGMNILMKHKFVIKAWNHLIADELNIEKLSVRTNREEVLRDENGTDISREIYDKLA